MTRTPAPESAESTNSQEQRSGARGWSLEGRVALVSGATGGLGKAIVTELRERGADVYGTDIAGEDVFHADLNRGRESRVKHVLATTGRLDILVLNAGCQFVAPIEQFPDAEWERLRSVMLDGPFLPSRRLGRP